MLEIADNLESRRRPARRCLTRRAESIVDLAHIRGAQLEAERGVDPHRIEKSAADELDAGNVRLRCADVFLDQRNAVDRIFERRAVDMRGQRVDTLEQLHAQALARAIVLGDERPAHFLRGRNDFVAADGCDGVWGADAVAAKRGVLRDLADFEPKRAAVVDYASAVRLQPGENSGGQLGRVTMAASVR